MVPGHCGIRGNDLVDAAAKRATRGIATVNAIPYTDYYAEGKKRCIDKWDEKWSTTIDKFMDIKSKHGNWTRTRKSRRDKDKLARLRMGRMRATHGHLLKGVGIPAPPCHYCNEEIVTVKRILRSCPVLRRKRVIFFKDETPELKECGAGFDFFLL